MALSNLLILAIIQGLAELLPVSSSAHVIMAEKILGLDPSAPDMTLLLVMLHSGTMFAVIVHFWKSWRSTYFSSVAAFKHYALRIFIATMMTGIVGLTLQHIIKVYFAGNTSNFEIESLFSNSKLIASGLLVSGILIIVSSRIKESHTENLSLIQSVLVGMVQGFCLPFRGLSRSGASISTALSIGVARKTAEEFSFALAVVLTPVVIFKEVVRAFHNSAVLSISSIVFPSLLGMVFSFIAGLVALRWLAGWLEHDKWHLFGGYCLLAACVILWIG
ncbi:undecaprenyl-diphosphate phosphatase [Escherichia coli]|uniref:Undecaprenyl-diphosphatase n=3 Tax=Enterobacteriaceae TaxID=543 RepID=F6IBB9_ECOLX|nr:MULTISPECIES: undecaprenyl-diphosphate phosphatase [Enterobacteriaceae]HBX7961908.1 undecaprenyl-diphosphate phosphatase [Klebsiella pneumoniae]HCM7777541.1 undecaprenyl-diphosphate phosphatase [Klebsiella quasipneumoniae subsp. similipneumoniae]HDR9925058.1 undecaprenyl-diphosphate phosphatase [Escherichia coli 2254-75 (11a)]EEY5945808.1 undecaprenyl-diphosphate phosphatase [Escherichia coli]EJC3516340.1 undecaprenyl-diphosphate phosphatase [Escherichia coli]